MLVDIAQTMHKTTAKKLAYDDDDDDDRSDANSEECGSYDEKDHTGNNLSMETSRDSHEKNNKNSLNELSTSMAADDRAHISLCSLPFATTRELMRYLDTDKGWEDVAAEAGFTFHRIQELGLKQHQPNGSATKALLWDLGCQGYKVTDLYELLRSAGRKQEMQILEKYVNAAGQEGKGAPAVGKKFVESPLLVSLPELLKQIKVQEDQQAKGLSESGFSSPGSDLNLNQSLVADQFRSKVGGAKYYNDKVIPGTDMQGGLIPCFSSLGKPSQPSSLHGASSSGSGSAFSCNSHSSYKTESSNPSIITNFRNQPSAFPVTNGTSAGGQSCGAENIQRMLNSVPGTGSNAATPHQSISGNKISGFSSIVSQQSTKTSPAKSSSSLLPTSSIQSEADIAISVKGTYSYNDLKAATQGFDEMNVIGQGAYGTVYRGALRHGECAIKRLSEMATSSPEKLNQVKSELAVLLKYQHENIVTPYGYAIDGPEICLVYQLLVNGSLEDRLSCKTGTLPLNWERRLNILLGACKGLNFLHTKGESPLIHGDIKSANILLDQYFEAKISDLGQAKYATSASTDTSGLTHITRAETTTKLFFTKAYQPPEMRSSKAISTKSDVYAMGVVILEVASGLPAHDQDRTFPFLADMFHNDVMEKSTEQWMDFQDQKLEDVPDNSFVDLLKLARKCLSTVKKQRPDSEKMKKEMDQLHNSYKTLMGYDSLSSLSSSLDMSAGSNMSRSVYQSQKSDLLPTGDMVSAPYGSQPQHILQLQKKRHQEFVSIHQESPRVQKPYKPHSSLPPQYKSPGLERDDQGSETVATRQESGPETGNLLRSFPQEMPPTEAYRLQAAYDCQREKKKIDRLSALSQATDTVVEDYPSDPVKMQNILEAERDFQPASISTTSADEGSCLQSDPKKLALLMGNYDDSTPQSDLEDSEKFESDPAKLAYLQNLDDSGYNHPKQSHEKLLAKYSASVADLQGTQAPYYGGEMQQFPAAVNEGQSVSSHLHSPISFPSSSQTHTAHCSQKPEQNNISNTCSETISVRCRRPSNDSNVHVPEVDSLNTNDGANDENSDTMNRFKGERPAGNNLMKTRMDLLLQQYLAEKMKMGNYDDEEYGDKDYDVIEETEPDDQN